MENPYLVQRLRKPYEPIAFPAPTGAEGFYLSFQEERREKQKASPELTKWISSIIHLDYMGSAEFEFGSVAKALHELATSINDFTIEHYEIKGKPYSFSLKERELSTKKRELFAERTAPVHLLVRKSELEETKKFIALFSEEDYTEKLRLKEAPYIRRGLFGEVRGERRNEKISHREPEINGWFDLNNLWFLSTSSDQIAGLSILLGYNSPTLPL